MNFRADLDTTRSPVISKAEHEITEQSLADAKAWWDMSEGDPDARQVIQGLIPIALLERLGLAA